MGERFGDRNEDDVFGKHRGDLPGRGSGQEVSLSSSN